MVGAGRWSAGGRGVHGAAHLVDGLADQAGPPGEQLDLRGVQAVLADVEADVGDRHAEDVDAGQEADDHPEDAEAVHDRLVDREGQHGVEHVADDLGGLLREQGVLVGVPGRGLGVGAVEVVLELADLQDADQGVDRAQEDHEELTEVESVLGDLGAVVLPGHGGHVEPDGGRHGSADDLEDQAAGAEEGQEAEEAEHEGDDGRFGLVEVGFRGAVGTVRCRRGGTAVVRVAHEI